jgi:hypothetical protein
MLTHTEEFGGTHVLRDEIRKLGPDALFRSFENIYGDGEEESGEE